MLFLSCVWLPLRSTNDRRQIDGLSPRVNVSQSLHPQYMRQLWRQTDKKNARTKESQARDGHAHMYSRFPSSIHVIETWKRYNVDELYFWFWEWEKKSLAVIGKQKTREWQKVHSSMIRAKRSIWLLTCVPEIFFDTTLILFLALLRFAAPFSRTNAAFIFTHQHLAEKTCPPFIFPYPSRVALVQ